MTIGLEIISGNRFVGDNDRYRAIDAALESLAHAGVSADVAFAEFRRQWEWLATDEAEAQGKCQDYEYLTGIAAAWAKAETAANLALTEGWADTAGASCSIYA